jgi:hypothetical protein
LAKALRQTGATQEADEEMRTIEHLTRERDAADKERLGRLENALKKGASGDQGIRP